jgi:sugar O-acyltransferase (sialic acid O-acetyltransferase NeuD family)
MAKQPLIVIGAGGHALSCLDVIEQTGLYDIVGCVGDAEQLNTGRLAYSVIAVDEDLENLAKKYRYAHVAVGQIKSPQTRLRLYERLKQLKFELPVLISPRAYVSKYANIGEGTIVMHHAVVNADAKIGVNCIVNTLSLIEHSVTIGDHCHIATRATVNGDVTIGRGTFVGSGATIKQGVTVGRDVLIGMASSVRKNLEDQTTYYEA